jgi:hypothetical protein
MFSNELQSLFHDILVQDETNQQVANPLDSLGTGPA